MQKQSIPSAFKNWQSTYKWLKLKSFDKAICSICTSAVEKNLLIIDNQSTKISKKAYVEDGFNCWKNATSVFKVHEKTAANSLARSFLKLNLLIPLINFYFQYLKFNILFCTVRLR